MYATIIPGVLPDPFCHESWQKTYEEMMAATRVEIPDSIGFTIGDKPGPNDRDKLWYFSTGDLRWYWPDNTTSKWISPHPIPPGGHAIQLWNGTEAQLATYDGGTVLASGELPSATKGPMWEIVGEMAGFTPVGVGKIGGKDDGTDLEVNETIGEETGLVIADHQHGMGVLYRDRNTDASWPTDGDFSDAGALRATIAPVTLPTEENYGGIVYDAAFKSTLEGAGATNLKKCTFVTTKQLAPAAGTPDKESKMQPSKAVYFIRRTARLYYAIDF